MNKKLRKDGYVSFLYFSIYFGFNNFTKKPLLENFFIKTKKIQPYLMNVTRKKGQAA